MAKYDVTHRCGHVVEHELFGKMTARDWKRERLAEEPCLACANQAAARENAAAGLPPIEGSPKQIGWAETIRRNALLGQLVNLESMKTKYLELQAYLVARLAKAREQFPDREVTPALLERLGMHERYEERADAVEQMLRTKTLAFWWIDHRDMDFAALASAVELPPTAEEQLADLRAEEQVAAVAEEVVMEAAEPVSKHAAEIRVRDGGRLEIEFPEKRDDFRELVRMTHDFRWDALKGCWARVVADTSVTPREKAAELAAAILRMGIAVRLADPEVRQWVEDGPVAENCRQIWKTTDKAVRFGIRWKRRDGDYYNQAHRLPGAGWSKSQHQMSVPPAAYEEVADFAAEHGFWISPGAQSLMDEMRAKREAEIHVAVDAAAPQVAQRAAEHDYSGRAFGVDSELADD